MDKLKPICKICSKNVYELHDEQFNTVYLRCESCGFIHLTETFHVTFDEERTEYDLHENSSDDEKYVKYLDRFLTEAVDPFIKKGKALDFGCGPEPVLASLLKKRGFSTMTYDRHYSHDEDALIMMYDLITSTEVFEHFHDPAKEMAIIASCIKSGGFLSIMTSVPPSDGPFLKWAYRREQTHISFYTEQALSLLAEKNKMQMVYHDQKRITVFKKL